MWKTFSISSPRVNVQQTESEYLKAREECAHKEGNLTREIVCYK